MYVCLFDERDARPASRSPSSPSASGTATCPASSPGQRYGFRADGPWDPRTGDLFNPDKLLLDPYARAIEGELTRGPTLGRGHRQGDRNSGRLGAVRAA